MNSILFVFFSYNWIIMALTYFIPVVVISATSAHMGYILWYKAPVGIVTAPIERARMKKKKVRVCNFGWVMKSNFKIISFFLNILFNTLKYPVFTLVTIWNDMLLRNSREILWYSQQFLLTFQFLLVRKFHLKWKSQRSNFSHYFRLSKCWQYWYWSLEFVGFPTMDFSSIPIWIRKY